MPENQLRLSICETLLGTGQVRIDSRSDDTFGCYGEDEEVLNEKRGRSCFIRVANRGERFDIGENLPADPRSEESINMLFITRPHLYVLVSRVGSTHVITPVYRSSQPFFRIDRRQVAVTTSDAEVGSILEECARRGGINTAEWNVFAGKLNAAAKAHREKQPVEPAEKLGPTLVQ